MIFCAKHMILCAHTLYVRIVRAFGAWVSALGMVLVFFCPSCSTEDVEVPVLYNAVFTVAYIIHTIRQY